MELEERKGQQAMNENFIGFVSFGTIFGGENGKLQSNCLPNSKLAWIRLYCSKSFKVLERHSDVLQFTSHTSLREWDRLRISNEVIAIGTP